MRWFIAENKKKIASENFEGHTDRIEMGGEQAACVVTYGVENGEPHYNKQFAFPNIRTQPNNTCATYFPTCAESPIVFNTVEKFERVEFDGVLSIFSRSGALEVVRRFFPSVEQPAFYERIELFNRGDKAVSPKWQELRRIDTKLVCEGCVYFECSCDTVCRSIAAGERVVLTFAYTVRFPNGKIPKEPTPLETRRTRVSELMSQCDITTGNDVVDTMFAFAKLRAAEGLCNTFKGLVHNPGGLAYYAAIWCNDQCEYVAPWFAFTGDDKLMKAVENIYGWYYPYFNDEFIPLPSSIICGGHDNFGCAGDRGDAEMYLYGLSRVLLTLGKRPDTAQRKALDWCVEYIKRNLTADDVVFSDSDELENRISSGVNLSTSSLAYGGLGNYALILKRMGDAENSKNVAELQSRIERGIENYFGGTVNGYETYHYHKGCDVIRAWNCLPVYMGITARAKDTLKSIGDRLWTDGSCRTTEGETTLWDRSALYYLAALFRAGEMETAWAKLKEYCESRLLGDHVPYAVEAYPEGGMRHLSGESGLFCRVFTDGLLNISFGEKGCVIKPELPREIVRIEVENIRLDGKTTSFVRGNNA